MKKKKIAFVIHSMSAGGAERVVSIIGNALSAHFEIFIVTISDTPSFYDLKESVTLLSNIKKPKPSKNIFTAIKSNFRNYRYILKILNQRQIDLCIAFMTENNILATLASKRSSIPIIISERNNPFVQKASMSFYWQILRRLVYPMSNLLVVQTSRIKTFYTPFIKERKLVTIPNPINSNFAGSTEFEKANIILNVGSLEHQKGQDVLIHAFSAAKLENWKLCIAGEGLLRPKLTELIAKLDLQERVFLLGKKQNIADYYACSKIFAFSSRYEGFPNALLEAMYSGLPCISTDCPTGPAEMINNGINGYLVAVDDIDAFALKLKKLADNDDLRISLGKAARQSVEKYRTEKIVEKWKQLIESLIS